MHKTSDLIDLVNKYKETGSPSNKEAIRDIITDIKHYCKAKGFQFDEIVGYAEIVFQGEVAEEN